MIIHYIDEESDGPEFLAAAAVGDSFTISTRSENDPTAHVVSLDEEQAETLANQLFAWLARRERERVE